MTLYSTFSWVHCNSCVWSRHLAGLSLVSFSPFPCHYGCVSRVVIGFLGLAARLPRQEWMTAYPPLLSLSLSALPLIVILMSPNEIFPFHHLHWNHHLDQPHISPHIEGRRLEMMPGPDGAKKMFPAFHPRPEMAETGLACS